MRRLLPLAVIAAILIGLALVLMSEPPGPRPPHDGGPPAPEKPVPTETAPELSFNKEIDSRTAIETATTAEELAELADGIGAQDGWPSFIGRVLLPSGLAAAETEIKVWAWHGWANAANPDDPQNPPAIRWQATTNAAGQFALPEAPQDGLRFILQFTHPDWPPLEMVNLPGHPGRTRPLGDIPLKAGFSISGQVADTDGRALADIALRPTIDDEAFTWGSPPTIPVYIGDYETTTDVEGKFTLHDLPSRRLRLVATGDGFARQFSSVISGKPESKQKGLHIKMSAANLLQGTLFSTDRQPLADARVRVDFDGDVELECQTDEHGNWSFDMPRETERAFLRYAAAGFWPARQRLDQESLTTKVSQELTPMPPSTGVVVDAHGRALANVQVALTTGYSSRSRMLDPKMLEANASTTTASDGTFALSPDMSRTWAREFHVVAWDDVHAPTFSKSLKYGYSNNAKDRVIPELRLVLDDGWSASGVVLDIDGAPRPNARVHLRRLKAQQSAVRRVPLIEMSVRSGTILRRVTTDEAGEFLFAGLREGDYRLEAHYPDRSPAESDDFILVGTSFEGVLQLHPSSGIDGFLDGDLTPFSTLRAQASAPGRDPLDTTLDSSGHFAFDNLAPDTWKVEIREADGSSTSRMTFTMGGGGDPLAEASDILLAPGVRVPLDLLLDFEGLGSISGMVTLNGVPAADMSLMLLPRGLGSDGNPKIAQRQMWDNLQTTQSDFQGKYQFHGLHEDDYWLVVSQKGDAGSFFFNYETVAESGPAGMARAEIDLAVDQNLVHDFPIFVGDLLVKTYKENGQPWRGWGELQPSDSMSGMQKRWVNIRKNGEMYLEHIPAGNWDLKLRGGDMWKVSHTPVTISGGGVTTVEVSMERAPRKDKTNDRSDGINEIFIERLGQ
ncbi:MAG: carboxypeptidase regulatory-like domain-containing protein [Planctomycetes bacterium]|nr:carboxypeptidase regulatory-like domain-containing protein [Planctomycetota bacterium]